MASAVESSGPTTASCDKGTAIVRPCQRISTSMSAAQASSGAHRYQRLTVSALKSGEPFFSGADAAAVMSKPDRRTERLLLPADRERRLVVTVGCSNCSLRHLPAGACREAVVPAGVRERELHLHDAEKNAAHSSTRPFWWKPLPHGRGSVAVALISHRPAPARTAQGPEHFQS